MTYAMEAIGLVALVFWAVSTVVAGLVSFVQQLRLPGLQDESIRLSEGR